MMTTFGGQRSMRQRQPVLIVCMVKGTELCHDCEAILNEDYYKGRKYSWCYECYKKTVNRKPIVRKARHCRFCHYHIGVPNIAYQMTTQAQVSRLARKENIMWLKYGDSS